MDYLAKSGGFDLDALLSGADTVVARGDVSRGAPAMETHTPTGNGTGVYQSYDWGTAVGGGLSKILDYAIRRDEIKMGIAAPMGQPTTQQQVQVQGKQTNGLFLILVCIGVYVIVKS